MENSIEKNLSLLLQLQELDKKISEMYQVRGGLPQEVRVLEDNLTSLQSQATIYQDGIVNLEQSIATRKIKIKDIENLLKRYEEQQVNVRNNREYDAITKEMELQHLDIQLAEKKIKEHYEQIEKNKQGLEELNKSIKKANQGLVNKQKDLNSTAGESKEEEIKLTKELKGIKALIDPLLLQSYERIKNKAKNGLAVVCVKEGACGGCFTTVYPQMQAEIKEKRQIFKCEHCGRIIADVAESVTIHSSEEDNQID